MVSLIFQPLSARVELLIYQRVIYGKMSGFQCRLEGWRVMNFFEIHLEWDIHIMGIYSRVGISMKYIR
jgi:hypothetical protein